MSLVIPIQDFDRKRKIDALHRELNAEYAAAGRLLTYRRYTDTKNITTVLSMYIIIPFVYFILLLTQGEDLDTISSTLFLAWFASLLGKFLCIIFSVILVDMPIQSEIIARILGALQILCSVASSVFFCSGLVFWDHIQDYTRALAWLEGLYVLIVVYCVILTRMG